MNRQTALIVVTQDPQLAEAVTALAEAEMSITACHVCRELDDLARELEHRGASAVLVDIDAGPARMLADLEAIAGGYDDTRFVIVAGRQDPEWMLRAMQAGARHFLVKDSIADELMKVLERVVPHGVSRNGVRGSMVTFLSAGGGCGATTIAINLANELMQVGGQPVLLLDLDCQYGGAAGFLGVEAQYGIADVLESGDRIDSHLIRSTAVSATEQLHVLASPATVDFRFPKKPDFHHLPRALQKMKEALQYTIVDAPRVPNEVAEALANASAMTYIVFELNVEDVRVARLMLQTLTERGIASGRVRPLVNRYRARKSAVSIADAKKAVGSATIDHLSNDYHNVSAGINLGRLLSDQAPRSALRKEIQELMTVVRLPNDEDKTPKALGT